MASEQDQPNVQSENFEEFDFEEDVVDIESPYSQSTRDAEEEDVGSRQEDEFSRLGDSSEDVEQKRLYMEYLSLIKEIDCQNQVVADIKLQVMELCGKACKTRCEMKEIKRLRTCMEQENLKLRCLIEKAMKLQNFGSHRRYLEIPIATTIDEDNMAPYVGTMQPQSANWKSASSEGEKSCSHQDIIKNDKAMRCIGNALAKIKVCCPADKKILDEITTILLGQGKKKKREPCRHAQVRRSKSMHDGKAMPCPATGKDSMDRLKQMIACMEASVNKLKYEMCKREKEKESRNDCMHAEKERNICQEESDPITQCLGKGASSKSEQMEKLKESYLYLLSEFSRKDAQIKELEKRLKGLCGGCDKGGKDEGDSKNASESELQLLRTRVNDMKEEQVEFKCIMKEQSQQLEDYRQKYLNAQQKVEEQSVTLEKLNMNNKRIEKQINTEVKEIRAKFQEKLNELLHFPKLLENEQLKLAQACKEKDELQSKLVLVCKELKSLKAQLEAPKDATDCRPQLAKCQLELQQTKTKLEELERQRDLFCEQLKTTQDDLDTLRSESAKIIARTKERAEMMKQQQQEQIDRLEKELAQCRATACLSVSDREAVIREMQGQLNTLAYSFDAAQKQIKTLRNHIAYVSNENCFPVKC